MVIFDADIEKQPVTEFIQEFKPHISITANTPQVKQARAQPNRSRKSTTARSCWVDRKYVSVLPEESCEKPYVDIVVRGEGEDCWIEICTLLENYLKDQPEFHNDAFMHVENEGL